MNENNNGNNMNVMDFNNNQNMYQQAQNNQVPNQPFMNTYNGVQQPNINTYSGVQQPNMNTYSGVQQPNMNVYNEVPQPNMNTYSGVPQMQNDINNVPVLDIEEDEFVKTPSDVFGVNVLNEQQFSNETTQMNNGQQFSNEISQMQNQQMVNEQKPKYGYASNEKANLNADENANIKFIIFLAILMLIVIILLPYLSNLI